MASPPLNLATPAAAEPSLVDAPAPMATATPAADSESAEPTGPSEPDVTSEPSAASAPAPKPVAPAKLAPQPSASAADEDSSKPMSFKERIAAFNKPTAVGAPPPTKPKPSGLATRKWAPVQTSAPKEVPAVSPDVSPAAGPPATLAEPDTTKPVERQSSGGFSAADAQAAVGRQGGSLKDRIAALQGLQFDQPGVPGRAPKPRRKETSESAEGDAAAALVGTELPAAITDAPTVIEPESTTDIQTTPVSVPLPSIARRAGPPRRKGAATPSPQTSLPVVSPAASTLELSPKADEVPLVPDVVPAPGQDEPATAVSASAPPLEQSDVSSGAQAMPEESTAAPVEDMVDHALTREHEPEPAPTEPPDTLIADGTPVIPVDDIDHAKILSPAPLEDLPEAPRLDQAAQLPMSVISEVPTPPAIPRRGPASPPPVEFINSEPSVLPPSLPAASTRPPVPTPFSAPQSGIDETAVGAKALLSEATVRPDRQPIDAFRTVMPSPQALPSRPLPTPSSRPLGPRVPSGGAPTDPATAPVPAPTTRPPRPPAISPDLSRDLDAQPVPQALPSRPAPPQTVTEEGGSSVDRPTDADTDTPKSPVAEELAVAPEPAEEEDPEQARRAAIAKRMAALGGVNPMRGAYGSGVQLTYAGGMFGMGGPRAPRRQASTDTEAEPTSPIPSVAPVEGQPQPPRRIPGLPTGAVPMFGMPPPRRAPDPEPEPVIQAETTAADEPDAFETPTATETPAAIAEPPSRPETRPPIPGSRPPPLPPLLAPEPKPEEEEEDEEEIDEDEEGVPAAPPTGAIADSSAFPNPVEATLPSSAPPIPAHPPPTRGLPTTQVRPAELPPLPAGLISTPGFDMEPPVPHHARPPVSNSQQSPDHPYPSTLVDVPTSPRSAGRPSIEVGEGPTPVTAQLPPSMAVDPVMLDRLADRIGAQGASATLARLNSTVNATAAREVREGSRYGGPNASVDFVHHVISAVADAAPPSDDGSYGYLTWCSTLSPAPAAVAARAGDVVRFSQAKFKGKLGQSSTVINGVGILAEEFDSRKKKLRVYEIGTGDKVEIVAHSLEALKSGRLDIFRVGAKAGP